MDNYAHASKSELILHGLKSLRETLAHDKELNTLNTSIAIVGIDTKFEVLDGELVKPWLTELGDVSSSRTRASREHLQTQSMDQPQAIQETLEVPQPNAQNEPPVHTDDAMQE